MLNVAVALLLGGAAPTRLPPVDQCRGDPEFDRFRRRLERAVASRDNQKLNPLMAPDVRLSFGVSPTDPRFRNYQRSGPGGDGMWQNALWDEMSKVLRLGCATARDGSYRAWPAMFVNGEGLEAFETWVSFPGAVLRRRPDARSPVGQRLPPWTVLHEVRESIVPFREVRTPKGRVGFVEQEELRSLVGYRLIAQRVDGRWLVTAFVAGD